jgi:hypothetical protein
MSMIFDYYEGVLPYGESAAASANSGFGIHADHSAADSSNALPAGHQNENKNKTQRKKGQLC